MKTHLLILTIFLVTISYELSSQEIFTEQTWELTKDINNDGWVNQGDVISFQVDITHNGKAQEIVSIDNLIAHEGLRLIPESVTSTKGNVITGTKVTDQSIHIEDVKLEAPWGYATLTFAAEVISDPDKTTQSINNHTTLSTSVGIIASNIIDIPRRTTYASNDSGQLSTTVLSLLGILVLGMLLGFASKRFKVANLSKAHV